MKPFAENRRARHDFEILEPLEGGLSLLGHEVKSIREGGAKLAGSYISIENGELWLRKVHIAPYSKAGGIKEYDPERERKILVTASELRSLLGKMSQKGLTLVPLSLYPRGRHIKLSFALCRGRKSFDKREKLKQRDLDREIRSEGY